MSNNEYLPAWGSHLVREQLEALGCRIDRGNVYPPPNGHWRYDRTGRMAHLVIGGGPFRPGGSEPVCYTERWDSVEWVINGKPYVHHFPK